MNATSCRLNKHERQLEAQSDCSTDTIFEPLLTAEEAAAHLRIHTKTLQKLARTGTVPCMRMGKYWRFHLSVLDAWLRAQENGSSQPFCVKNSGV
jgi:excisionase family DNA binding protein